MRGLGFAGPRGNNNAVSSVDSPWAFDIPLRHIGILSLPPSIDRHTIPTLITTPSSWPTSASSQPTTGQFRLPPYCQRNVHHAKLHSSGSQVSYFPSRLPLAYSGNLVGLTRRSSLCRHPCSPSECPNPLDIQSTSPA